MEFLVKYNEIAREIKGYYNVAKSPKAFLRRLITRKNPNFRDVRKLVALRGYLKANGI